MSDSFDLSKPPPTPAAVPVADIFDLSKASHPKIFKIGLGWDEPEDGTIDYELTAFGCVYDSTGDNPTVLNHQYVIFYKQPTSPDGAILRIGGVEATDTVAIDQLDGDDEVIIIDTTKLDPKIQEISIVVTIYDGVSRGQTFGEAPSGCRVYDGQTGTNLLELKLSEDYSPFTAVQIGSVYKEDDGVWSFKTIGQGFQGAGLADFFGIYVPDAQVRSEHG